MDGCAEDWQIWGISVKRAYSKDIFRSIVRTKKRFISILIITALGVTVLTGIYAACRDMYFSADSFYDRQNLFDVRILSTLGLTEEDVEALRQVPGILQAEGSFSGTVYTVVEEMRKSSKMEVLSGQGINLPYVTEGRLPEGIGEMAVTRKFLEQSGKSIGDVVVIEEEDAENAKKADNTEFSKEEEDSGDGTWNHEYIITGVAVDPRDISNDAIAFRSTTDEADYTFFVTSENTDSEVYSCMYLTLDGAKELDCFTDEYNLAVKQITDVIETNIKQNREKARYQSVMEEAEEKIADAREEMNEKFGEAEAELSDAWQEIGDGKAQLDKGEQELSGEARNAEQKIADARKELADAAGKLADAQQEISKGETELADARRGLEAGEGQLAAGRAQLEQGKKQAEEEFAEAYLAMDGKQKELEAARTSLESGTGRLQGAMGAAWPQKEWDHLRQAAAVKAGEQLAVNPEGEIDADKVASATASQQEALTIAVLKNNSVSGNEMDFSGFVPDCIQTAIGMGITETGQHALEQGRLLLEQQKTAVMKQLSESEKELNAGLAQTAAGWLALEEAQKELDKGKTEIENGLQELEDGQEELNRQEVNAKSEIARAGEELQEGRVELEDGEKELIANQEDYFREKADAETELEDARKKLDDIDMAEWYVQDRSSLDSFSSLKSDMAAIKSVGGAFPVVFLTVAILISLTTMTRMIEEERGLIGTYKALGMGNAAVCTKYMIYAASACILGGLLGYLLGFVALPLFLIEVLKKLYILPEIRLQFDSLLGIGGGMLFLVGIVGAAVLACSSELKQMPASLMRPKAPRSGSRVLFERIPFLWKRLRFLEKVTVRNLFRYKKRFFMTVLGIMGCTALVLSGLAIKDSVVALMPRQYEETYQYDLMVVSARENNQELLNLAKEQHYIEDYINLGIDSSKIINQEGVWENVQVIVVPDGETLEGFISLQTVQGEKVLPDDTGILVTQNASEMLDVGQGDDVSIRNLDLAQGEVRISGVVRNYLGNNVYMTAEVYESLFGTFSPNGLLAHISEVCEDQAGFAADLADYECVLTAVSVEGLVEDFSLNFTMINAVVYVIIVLAAGLAFVVLFTLSNTNISERVRELATIKVLGFFDREVHSYVNKETLILTFLGIMAGMPVGWFLSNLLTSALKMPSMYFAVYIAPGSYVLAAAISFAFALTVNLITNVSLNHINMVEALKSVE